MEQYLQLYRKAVFMWLHSTWSRMSPLSLEIFPHRQHCHFLAVPSITVVMCTRNMLSLSWEDGLLWAGPGHINDYRKTTLSNIYCGQKYAIYSEMISLFCLEFRSITRFVHFSHVLPQWVSSLAHLATNGAYLLGIKMSFHMVSDSGFVPICHVTHEASPDSSIPSILHHGVVDQQVQLCTKIARSLFG